MSILRHSKPCSFLSSSSCPSLHHIWITYVPDFCFFTSCPTLLVLQNYKPKYPQQKMYYIIFTAIHKQQPTSFTIPIQKRVLFENNTTRSLFPKNRLKCFFSINQKVLGQAQCCLYLGRRKQPGWGPAFTSPRQLPCISLCAPFWQEGRAVGQLIRQNVVIAKRIQRCIIQ